MTTTYGDMRLWMTAELHKALEGVINHHTSLTRRYYIIVVVKDGYHGVSAKVAGKRPTKDMNLEGKKVITTRLIVSYKPPVVPQIGTAVWRIDNKRGEAKCLYILPPDAPIMTHEQLGEEATFVFKSAEAIGAPLIYN